MSQTTLQPKQASQTSFALNALLADYQVLYQKLRGYHWNIRGPQFFELHARFEQWYTEAAERVDQLAERLSYLGVRPWSTLQEQLAAARLEEDGRDSTPNGSLRQLLHDYERLNGWLRAASESASEDRDIGTANLLDAMADGQETIVWMLRSYLELDD